MAAPIPILPKTVNIIENVCIEINSTDYSTITEPDKSKKCFKDKRGRHKKLQNHYKLLRTRHSFSPTTKEVISNVFFKSEKLFPRDSIAIRTAKVSELTGVSTNCIWKIRKEFNDNGKFIASKKDRIRRPVAHKHWRYLHLDSIQLNYIRNCVHEFYLRNELPTLNKLMTVINKEGIVPKFSRSTLTKILRKIGFRYETRRRHAALLERDDIVCWRRHYLREMSRFREEGRVVYYTDETCIDEGQIAIAESNGDHGYVVKGKNRRLIVAHIGSEDGFVRDGQFICRADNDDAQMNEIVYNNWLESIFPKLEKNAVIVMDNVPYHTVEIDRAPSRDWPKDEIIMWLEEKDIEIPERALKSELMALVNANKERYKTYHVDSRAEELGFRVLRLPPYHCSLNPIEMVWAQVKSHVRTNRNKDEVETVLNSALSLVTAEKWRSYVRHVIKEEEKLWEFDEMIEQRLEPVKFDEKSTESESEGEIDDETCDKNYEFRVDNTVDEISIKMLKKL